MQVPEAKPPQLSVSIVVYNSSLELLERTLTSLQVAAVRAFRDVGVVTRLMVVDNHSHASYSAELARLLETFVTFHSFSVELMTLEYNGGFGVGHNRVIETLSSDFHLVLNPDVEMAENIIVEGIARLQKDRSVALLSPRASGPTGRQEFLCKRYPSVLVLCLRALAPASIRKLFRRRLGKYELRDRCAGDSETVVPLASGCFMLVRREQLQSIDGFNEAYFLYFEDFDLSIRMGRHGNILYMPMLEIVHHGGYAGSKGLQHFKYFSRSAVQFFRQHGWRWI